MWKDLAVAANKDPLQPSMGSGTGGAFVLRQQPGVKKSRGRLEHTLSGGTLGALTTCRAALQAALQAEKKLPSRIWRQHSEHRSGTVLDAPNV